MSRDDSILHTGLTSASFASRRADEMREKQDVAKQERLDKQQKLKPAAEVVLALIDKHKNAAKYVENVTGGLPLSDKEAGELLRSQRLVYKFLQTFENEIKIALKDVT